MTALLILGIPSAAHREALLRETAGGGRAPVMSSGSVCAHHQAWCLPEDYRDDCYMCRNGRRDALLLSHPTDPEAGAMGLARLAWVAGGAGAWFSSQRHDEIVSSAHLHAPNAHGGTTTRTWSRHTWSHEGNNYRQVGHAAEAIGLVCVHLGLLERVERVEVPHGG